jgi:hypothetical protein
MTPESAKLIGTILRGMPALPGARCRRDVRVNIVQQWENGEPVIVFGVGSATLDGSPAEWTDVAARLVDVIEQARQGPP